MTSAADGPTPSIDPGIAQRRAGQPENHVWVGASAGTGKTKVLTDRYVRLLLSGTRPDKILCLTFTKAAATEMANRISRRLAKWTILDDARLDQDLADLTGQRPAAESRAHARQLFARFVESQETVRIQTIHAFCQSVVRRFPLEAGVAPHFQVMEETEARALLTDARNAILRSARAEPDTPLGHAIGLLIDRVADSEFDDLLAGIIARRGLLARLIRDHGGIDALVSAIEDHVDGPRPADEEALAAAFCDERNVDRSALRDAAGILINSGKPSDTGRGQVLADWLSSDAATRQAGLDRYLGVFLTSSWEPRKKLATKDASAAQPALERERDRALAYLEDWRRARTVTVTAALLRAADAILAHYGDYKRVRARFDYDDLILTVRRLLSDADAADWVLFKLDGGIDHILIDEAQDTNPDQWAVVQALAEDFLAGESARPSTRTVFAVGDEKQSIYSFQGAEPAAFMRMRQYFARRVRDGGGTWDDVDLALSFRSTRAVLEAVDTVFADPQIRHGVVSDPEQPIRHDHFRRGQAGLVELWPLIAAEKAEDPEPWEPPIRPGHGVAASSALIALVADRIKGWLANGEILESRGRPIRADDILILVRQRSGFLDDMVRALKQRNIPVAGADRIVLTEQIACQDLIALANVLLLPEDDLTLAAVLKGPLIGLDEDTLFRLAWQRKGSLWRALARAARGDDSLRTVATYLNGWLDRVDHIGPYELFARLLGEACPADPRSGRRALMTRLGHDCEDPINELLSAALNFEARETPSLQRFVAWFASGDAEIKRESEQAGTPQVRIMTVHGAKGLQAPIVILPDAGRGTSTTPRMLWPDEHLPVPLCALRTAEQPQPFRRALEAANQRQEAERRRLLYVAMTRAEDRLYVCGWQGLNGTAPNAWHPIIESGLKAIAEEIPFDPPLPAGVVTDGPALRLSYPQVEPVVADHRHDHAAASPPALPDWLFTPPPSEPSPPRPLAPSRPAVEDPPVRSPAADDDGPHRYLRGRLIHTLLQYLPEIEPQRRDTAARAYLDSAGRELDERRRAEIGDEVLKILNDPDIAPMFGGDALAEAPVTGLLDDGTVVSGQVDRLLVEPDQITIIDFKTNRPPPDAVEDVPTAYVRQLARYRSILTRIYPGRSIRCLLLWTDGPRLMTLPPTLLDPAP